MFEGVLSYAFPIPAMKRNRIQAHTSKSISNSSKNAKPVTSHTTINPLQNLIFFWHIPPKLENILRANCRRPVKSMAE